VSLCLQVEQAAARWLRRAAGALWKTESGSYIVDEAGINIKFGSGFKITVQVLTDEGNVNVVYPAIVCGCPQLAEPEPFFPHGNHSGELHVTLTFPADDWSKQPDVLAALEDTAANMYRALYRPDLAMRLSEQVENFSCIAIDAPRQQTRSRDGRLRIYSMTQIVLVCNSDFADYPGPDLTALQST
jgi:hypothetical protein